MTILTKSSALKSSGIAPLIIAFTPYEHVQEWLDQTECPFPAYVDASRALYTTFGLPRSLLTLKSSVMRYYAEKVVKGEELPNMGVKEDTIQLGGDFTVETANFTMTFLYPSKTSTDRPTLDQILR